jgi:hypothetical protein
MSKRSQTNVSQHNKALEVMLKYFDVVLFVSLVLFLDCAGRFCLCNKFLFFFFFKIQGVIESCTDILITSYWFHVELGKNILKIL